jgi:hypothetical protein
MKREDATYWLNKFEARLKEPRLADTEMGEWYRTQVNKLKRMLHEDNTKAPEAQA